MTPATSTSSELSRRIVSGALMAVVALGIAWWGGYPFAIFWTAAGLLVLGEWDVLVTRGEASPVRLTLGGVAITAAAVAGLTDRLAIAVLLLLAGAAAVAALRRGRADPLLAGLGVPYAGAMAVPIIALRDGSSAGLAAVLFVFAIVWGSDIMAYFTGRAFGGPKLMPSVSPKKTWSGFAGGTLCGAAAATLVAVAAGFGNAAALLAVAALLAALSQAGDLLESALKRRFGAKDASQLIPGHGGLMDRLDGFVAVSLGALAIGALRNPADPALGLLSW